MNEQLTEEQAKQLWNQLDAQDGAPPQPEAGPSEEPTPVAGGGDEGAAQAAPETTEDDRYEGLPASVKDELIGLKALVSQLTGRVRNAEGHIGGLKSQLQSQIDAAKGVRAAGGDAPSASEIARAQGDPEAFSQLKKDYPEFAEAIDSALNAKVAALRQSMPQQGVITRDEMEQMRSSMRDEIERETRVEMRHPGWKKLVRSTEFVGWHEQQKPEIKALSASPDPDDAIRLLDLFTESRRPRQQQERSLLSAAALPSGRSQGVRVKPIEEMTRQEYWAYLDEQERANTRR